jgi:hypothetical protein
MNASNSYNPQGQSELFYTIVKYTIIFLVIGLIGYGIYTVYKDTYLTPKKDVIGAKIEEAEKIIEKAKRGEGQRSLYKTTMAQLDETERYLVNLIPLTASLGGYIGNNVFSSDLYIRTALRAGIRSFILPISTYTDDNKKPPYWPYSGEPVIAKYNPEGNITSMNGLSIKKFVESLLLLRNTNDVQADEPILLYIEEQKGRVPDKVKEEKEYVKFMSKIATELKALEKSMMNTLGSLGTAKGGGVHGSKILLETPLTQLKNKILIFTNFDVFLATKKEYSNIKPRLFDYTNFLYGVTDNEVKQTSVEAVKGGKEKWSTRGRTNWVLTTKTDPYSLNKEDVRLTIKEGVQGIPIPFIEINSKIPGNNKENFDSLLSVWEGYAFKPKAKNLRYSKPKPVVPQKPSTKMNASVKKGVEPGQIIIK